MNATPNPSKEKVIESYTALADYYGDDFNAFFYPFILTQIRKWKEQGKALNRGLEIGSGGGGLALEVSKYIPDLCGIDITAKMVEIAQAKAAHAHSSVRFIQGDFQEDVLPDNNDLIYTLYVLAYAQNLEAALRKIDSLLSPQGKVLLIEYAYMPLPADQWLSKHKILYDILENILQPLSILRFLAASLWLNKSIDLRAFWKAMSQVSRLMSQPAWKTLDKTRIPVTYPRFAEIIRRVWPTARIHKIMLGECLVIYEKE